MQSTALGCTRLLAFLRHQTYTNSKMPFRYNGSITVNEEEEEQQQQQNHHSL